MAKQTHMITVPMEKYEEGIRAIDRIGIIKRQVRSGFISMEFLYDILDIQDDERIEMEDSACFIEIE